MGKNCPETAWRSLTYLKTWQRCTWFASACTITLLALLSNTAVILSIFRTNQENNVFCRLMLFLSLSDCSLALATQASASVLFFKSEVSCTFEITSQFFTTLFAYLSGYIIVATSFERMININHIQQIRQNVPVKRAYLIWIICVLLAFLSDLSHTTFTVYGMYNSFEHATQIMVTIALILVFLSHTIMYRNVSHYVGVILINTSNTERGTASNRPIYLHLTAKVVKRILTALCIAYMPYIFLNLFLRYGLNTKNPKHTSWISFEKYLTYMLVYFNSVMNAIIFILGNRKCITYIKMCFARKRISNGHVP